MDQGPLLLFDGHCGICTRWVRFLLRRDRRRRTLRFAPLDGPRASGLLERHPEARGVDSVLWYEPAADGGRLLLRSDAVLAAARYLGGGWRLAAALGGLCPRGLRDRIYDAVARRRRVLPGGSVACELPTPEESVRFLDR